MISALFIGVLIGADTWTSVREVKPEPAISYPGLGTDFTVELRVPVPPADEISVDPTEYRTTRSAVVKDGRLLVVRFHDDRWYREIWVREGRPFQLLGRTAFPPKLTQVTFEPSLGQEWPSMNRLRDILRGLMPADSEVTPPNMALESLRRPESEGGDAVLARRMIGFHDGRHTVARPIEPGDLRTIMELPDEGQELPWANFGCSMFSKVGDRAFWIKTLADPMTMEQTISDKVRGISQTDGGQP